MSFLTKVLGMDKKFQILEESQKKANDEIENFYIGEIQSLRESFKTDPKSDELYAWLCTNLSAIYKLGGFIGGWNNNNIFFLDVVATIPSYENAMLAGRMNGEEEIYHP